MAIPERKHLGRRFYNTGETEQNSVHLVVCFKKQLTGPLSSVSILHGASEAQEI